MDCGAYLILVNERIAAFAAQQQFKKHLSAGGSTLSPLIEDYVANGKRLRPRFAYWGYTATGQGGDDASLVDVGAALEFFQAFALLHDDVMDGSEERRGRAAAHSAERDRHAALQWAGESRRFGEGVAILLGDLAFVYADMLVSPYVDLLPIWNEMRLELVAGQHLDMLNTARRDRDPANALLVATYKSGKYTVERPLHLGAAVSGASDAIIKELSAIGLPLGRAFQLRDDVLGVFGDPAVTGKPVGDDLREGKPTVLLAYATEAARGADKALLEQIGRPDLSAKEIDDLQEVLRRTGALARTEEMIAGQYAEALEVLARAPFKEHAKEGLRDLAKRCVERAA